MTTTFARLSGPDFLKLSHQQIKALSLDELQLLVRHSQRLLATALFKPVQCLFEVMPDEFVIEILLVWLDIEELAVFDLALMNHHYRDKYLSLLRDTVHKGVLSVSRDTRRFGYKNKKGHTIKFGFYQGHIGRIGYKFDCGVVEWLESRNIFMRGLQFHGEYDFPEGFLERTGLQLLHISITYCDSLSDAKLAQVVRMCPRIEVLHLNFCRLITEVGVSTLAQLCPMLHTLNLWGMHVTDTWLTRLGECCKTLKTINLEDCSHISDMGLCKLAEGCRMLEDVHLSDCGGDITDVGVCSLGLFCPKLHTLNLLNLWRVTDIGITQLGVGCLALKNINLTGTKISDDGLCKLSQGCPGLVSVNLYDCHITDEGVSSLARYCPGLRYVDLVYTHVTYIGLTQLGEHCRSLKQIRLHDYLWSDDEGLDKILEHNSRLELVIVGGGCDIILGGGNY